VGSGTEFPALEKWNESQVSDPAFPCERTALRVPALQ